MLSKNTIDPRFELNPTLPGVPDPYPIYRAVREADPVHWCPGANLWAVMRYDDAEAVLKDPRLSRQAYLDALERRTGPEPIIEMQRHELAFTDNPRHSQLRQIIGDAINAQAIRDLRVVINALVEQRLAPLLSRGKFDVVGDFLLTLPTGVGAAWLGVPEKDHERIRRWIFPLVSGRGVTHDPKTTAAANEAAKGLRAYFDDLIQLRRVAPKDDLISALLVVQRQAPSLLSDNELFALIVAVFAGGHTPGIALLAGTLLALLQFPDQLARLRDDPALLSLTIEEGLRYTSPTQATNPLAALEDISIRGKTIRKGELLTVILGSANRDPEIFPNPDRFDAGRTPNRHLAFSGGPHYCLGAMLTRLLAQSILATVVQRLPGLRLACNAYELIWKPHDRFRLLTALPIQTG